MGEGCDTAIVSQAKRKGTSSPCTPYQGTGSPGPADHFSIALCGHSGAVSHYPPAFTEDR